MNSFITKRVDNLGRIVIPKEIRKKLHINDGELLNIDIEDNKIIIYKKKGNYKVLKFLDIMTKSLNKFLHKDIVIFDINGSYCLSSKNITFNTDFINKFKSKPNIIFYENMHNKVIPFFVDGYLYGAIIIFSYKNETDRNVVKEFLSIIEKYIEE